jgi:RNA polymerase sigma factor (sigma-70 family)
MENRPLRPVVRYIRHLAGTTEPLPDRLLLDSFRSGQDEQAFASLMEKHGPLVLGVCRRVLHNEHDAEDVFQSTFLVLAKKAGSIRQHESIGAWLYRVAYHLAVKLRSRVVRAQEKESQSTPQASPDPVVDISLRELQTLLDEELARLPEKYRAPLVLCYLAGKTRDEAAEELGWSVGAVKGRLERGRDLLRSRLQRRGLTLSAALLGTMLASGAASAAVPSTLTTVTMKAVGSLASGAVIQASPRVVELAQFGITLVGVSKVKLAAVLLLGCLLAGIGAVMLVGEQPVNQRAANFSDADVNQRPAPAFIDITRECGLEKIVNDKYAASPQWWLSGLHLVDLDGDGHLDFFMSAHGGGGAVATLNDGKGNFKLAPGTYPTTEIHLAYDVNEDGLVDLTMTYQDGGGQWWINKSKPGMLDFEAMPATQRGTNTARRQAMIDINRDGKVDWIRGTPPSLIFEHGDGKGGFANNSGRLATNNPGKGESLCIPVDLFGSGFIDFIVEYGHYDWAVGHSRVFRNDGKGNFTDVTKEIGLPTDNISIKGVGDLNGDGFPDLIVLEDKKPALYLNDGKGKFVKKPEAFVGMEKASKVNYSSWGLAVVTDIDNDGVPDILWNGKNFLWVLRGQGDGTFKYMNTEWGIKDTCASSVDDGLCFGDINGDGMLDIVGYTAIGNNRRFAVYRNNLPKQNYINVRPIGLAGNKGAAGAKIRLLEPGTNKLLWYEQVAIWDSQASQSYYSFAETERHFGLGKRDKVDVEVEFYPSGKKVVVKDAPANRTVRINEN